MTTTTALSITQAAQLARAAGFPAEEVPTAVAIAIAESGLNPRALNDNAGTGDYSVGLWQINMRAHGTRFGTEAQLKTPSVNARAAYQLWTDAGGFTPWSTYKKLTYQTHLGDVRTALEGASVGAGGPQLAAGNWGSDIIDAAEAAGRAFTGDPSAVGDLVGGAADLLGLDDLRSQILTVGLSLVFTTAALGIIAVGLFRLTGTNAGDIFRTASGATGAGAALRAVV